MYAMLPRQKATFVVRHANHRRTLAPLFSEALAAAASLRASVEQALHTSAYLVSLEV